MPATVSAAIRILRSIPGRRPVPEGHDESVPLNIDPTDPITLCNEFDRDQSLQDLKNQLEKAGYTDVEIVFVSLDTIDSVSDELEKEMRLKQEHGQDLVVFQLCDGTELDGYPGVSIVQALERRNIAFTGSDSAFYIISSSKPILKRELQAARVPTSVFKEFVTTTNMEDLEDIVKEIGFPMIVKPSISYASINISMKSVVHNPEQLLEQVNLSLNASQSGAGKCTTVDQKERTQDAHTDEQEGQQKALQQPSEQIPINDVALLKKEKRLNEIDIETPTVFVEKFLAGREFTALVIGDRDWGVRVFPVAERAFDPRLGKFERLLAFDQYWDGYDLEGGMGNEDFCKYQMANDEWQQQLQDVAKNAYLALEGNGYGRVDIRTTEMDSCNPVVLEVNANCGLSFEKDTSSLANILIMSNVPAPGFVHDLIDHAIARNKRKNGTHFQQYHQAHWLTSNSSIHSDVRGRVEVGHVEVLVRS